MANFPDYTEEDFKPKELGDTLSFIYKTPLYEVTLRRILFGTMLILINVGNKFTHMKVVEQLSIHFQSIQNTLKRKPWIF